MRRQGRDGRCTTCSHGAACKNHWMLERSLKACSALRAPESSCNSLLVAVPSQPRSAQGMPCWRFLQPKGLQCCHAAYRPCSISLCVLYNLSFSNTALQGFGFNCLDSIPYNGTFQMPTSSPTRHQNKGASAFNAARRRAFMISRRSKSMIEVQRLTMTAAVVREMHRVDFERILRGVSGDVWHT